MTRNRPDDESSENGQSRSSTGDDAPGPDDQSAESESGFVQSNDNTTGSEESAGSANEEDDQVSQNGPPSEETQVTGDSNLPDQLYDEVREVNTAVSTASTGSDHLVAALRMLEAGDSDATRQELRAAEATLREASETLLAVAERISDDDGHGESDDDTEVGEDDEPDDGSASRVINTEPGSSE